MKNVITKILHSRYLYSAISILLGGLFFIPGNIALKITITTVGALISLFGLYVLFVGIFSKSEDNQDNRNLILPGILIFLFGGFFSIIVWFLLNVFLLIIGLILIGTGLYGLVINLRFATTSLRGKIATTILYLLEVVIGVFLIINMNSSFTWASYLIGGLLILLGISTIINESVRIKFEQDIIKQAKINSKKVNDDVIEASYTEKDDQE